MSHIRGRFNKPADKLAAQYTASLPVDKRLYRHDIDGSIAHAKMLGKQSIISDEDAASIVTELESIREEIEQGKFKLKPEFEDIHMAIETRLIEKIGDAGRKLHTARSRNDQIALDMRLFTREAIVETVQGIKELQRALLDIAEANKTVIGDNPNKIRPGLVLKIPELPK